MATEQFNYRRKVSQRKPIGKSDPFRSTNIWNQIITDFRKRMLEAPSLTFAVSSLPNGVCVGFSGADAVDKLILLLKEKQEVFAFKEVTEDKAKKLCDIFLRDNTIAAVDTKYGKQFQASKSAFYYFTHSSKSNETHVEQGRERSISKKSNNESSTHTSPNNSSATDDIERLMQDFALARLLTLVDIPILEGILEMRSGLENGSALKTLESLFRNIKITRSRHDQSPDLSSSETAKIGVDDKFIAAGYRCLQYCQKSNVVDRNVLYGIIVESYKSMTSKRGPLIPRQFTNILDQIAYLIVTEPAEADSKALEACQYLYMLLPKEGRDQFSSLFELMVAIRHMKAPLIDISLAMDTFRAFILPKDVQNSDHLFKFMLANIDTILASPKELYQPLVDRHDVESTPGLVFCIPVTPEEYRLQAKTETEQALFNLLWNVVQNDGMNDGDKKLWLVEFRKAYPQIYSAAFPNEKL